MAFDPTMFAAKWYAGLLFPEDVPDLAANALEAGFDGPALRRLAGLTRPTSVDIQPWMETALREIGNVEPLSKKQAIIKTARHLAKEIVEGSVNAFEGCSVLASYAMSAEYPPDLVGFFQLDEEPRWGKYARGESLLHQAIIEEARKFLDLPMA